MRAFLVLLFPSLALAGQFKLPDGWVDLTPGVAPPSVYQTLDPVQRATIQSGQYAFFAADLEHRTPTMMTNVNVTLADETPRIDERFLRWYVGQLPTNSALPPGTTWTHRESSLVEIGGVTCARISADMRFGLVTVRNLQYVVPLGNKSAFITYTTEPSQFAKYEPIFDAAARATTGLAAPLVPKAAPDAASPVDRVGRAAVRGAIFGAIAAAIAVPLVAVARRRKKKS